MKLHLLRHAKTNQTSKTNRDFDRKLLKKGEKQACEMVMYLSGKINFNETEVHCSSSLRTKQTFEIISQKIDFPFIHFSNNLYLGSHIDLLKYVNFLNTKKDILIIGHNSGISDFASYLTGDEIYFKTCTYCYLEIDIDKWSELSKYQAKLVDMYRPNVD